MAEIRFTSKYGIRKMDWYSELNYMRIDYNWNLNGGNEKKRKKVL